MTFQGRAAIAASVVGWLWCSRFAFREFIRDQRLVVDWGDVVFWGFVGMLCGLGFPVLIVSHAFRLATRNRDAAAFARKIGGTTKEDRELARRERAVKIAQMEQELGIGS